MLLNFHKCFWMMGTPDFKFHFEWNSRNVEIFHSTLYSNHRGINIIIIISIIGHVLNNAKVVKQNSYIVLGHIHIHCTKPVQQYSGVANAFFLPYLNQKIKQTPPWKHLQDSFLLSHHCFKQHTDTNTATCADITHVCFQSESSLGTEFGVFHYHKLNGIKKICLVLCHSRIIFRTAIVWCLMPTQTEFCCKNLVRWHREASHQTQKIQLL